MPKENPITSKSGTTEQSVPKNNSRQFNSLFFKAFPIARATMAWENADAIRDLHTAIEIPQTLRPACRRVKNPGGEVSR
jgi:hypothetical protein